MCGLAKYGEASVKTSYDQLYAYIIIYFIIEVLTQVLRNKWDVCGINCLIE